MKEEQFEEKLRNPHFHEIYERLKFVVGYKVTKAEILAMVKKIDVDQRKEASATVFCTYTNSIENKKFSSQKDYTDYILLNDGVAKHIEFKVEAYKSEDRIIITGDDSFKPDFVMKGQGFKNWIRSK